MKIGTNELVIILLIAMIVFGPSQIPRLTRMLGQSIEEFQKGMNKDNIIGTNSNENGEDDCTDNHNLSNAPKV